MDLVYPSPVEEVGPLGCCEHRHHEGGCSASAHSLGPPLGVRVSQGLWKRCISLSGGHTWLVRARCGRPPALLPACTMLLRWQCPGSRWLLPPRTDLLLGLRGGKTAGAWIPGSALGPLHTSLRGPCILTCLHKCDRELIPSCLSHCCWGIPHTLPPQKSFLCLEKLRIRLFYCRKAGDMNESGCRLTGRCTMPGAFWAAIHGLHAHPDSCLQIVWSCK